MKKKPDEIIDLHIKLFIKILEFLRSNHITTYREIVDYKTKGVLDEPLWKLVEAYGKYNVQYMSEGVHETILKLKMDFSKIKINEIELFLKNSTNNKSSLKNVITRKEDCKVHLEHVTPRKKIIEEVLKLHTETEIRNYLNKMCIGCIVLKSEHRRLDDKVCNNVDVWQRYKNANIKVFNKNTGKWVWK